MNIDGEKRNIPGFIFYFIIFVKNQDLQSLKKVEQLLLKILIRVKDLLKKRGKERIRNIEIKGKCRASKGNIEGEKTLDVNQSKKIAVQENVG